MIWNAMRDENEDGFKGSSVRGMMNSYQLLERVIKLH
jgi:hypothetical protein